MPDQNAQQKIKYFFLVLTILSGIIALSPYQNFQYWIAQGDHGRDLYAFKKTMEGALPYRDYSWQFGPLMPYYYSLFFKFLGVHIQSILWGQNLLYLAAGLLVFLTANIFISPSLSYVAALWYWAFRGMDFFYTYNHVGGVVAILAAFYSLLCYINIPRRSCVLGGLASCLALMLIRLNMGIATLTALGLGILFCDLIEKNPRARQNRRTYGLWILGTLGVALGIYAFFFLPLPFYIFYESFPFKKEHRTDMAPSIFIALRWLVENMVRSATASFPRLFFSSIILFAGAQTALTSFDRKTSSAHKRKLAAGGVGFLFFLLFNLHEYILSGVFYRLSWVFPLLILLCFFLLHGGIRALSSTVKLLVTLTLFLLSANSLSQDNTVLTLAKRPENSLTINGERIYTYQTTDWFLTVQYTTAFIQSHVPPGQPIFALPFDPLYYYLTGRDSANRQLIFFEHSNIPVEQEEAVIADLNRTRVPYIILSNRMHAPDDMLGTLGKDYCLRLYAFIAANYEVVVTVGPWDAKPWWAWNHGVKILKRKSPDSLLKNH